MDVPSFLKRSSSSSSSGYDFGDDIYGENTDEEGNSAAAAGTATAAIGRGHLLLHFLARSLVYFGGASGGTDVITNLSLPAVLIPLVSQQQQTLSCGDFVCECSLQNEFSGRCSLLLQ